MICVECTTNKEIEMKDQKKTKEENHYGKYVFSEEEKAEIASNLTTKITEKNHIEDEKKSAMSSFKAQLDSMDAIINKLSVDYQNGYEFKLIECRVEYDYTKKIKSYWRKDNGELIVQRPLTPDELQTDMDLE